MAGFVARWLSDALRLGLALAFGLAAMQVPALTYGHAAALLQIAEDARRDIEQWKAAARRIYPSAGHLASWTFCHGRAHPGGREERAPAAPSTSLLGTAR